MKVLYSWLKEHVDLTLSPNEISEALTLGGLEVEGIDFIEKDPVFEISLTPNLGHAMSLLGIARELSALLNLKVKKVIPKLQENSSESIHKMIDVSIEDKEQCLRYACRIVTDVKVGPSPDWLKHRLESCGIRSINNVVDIGNYVMLEMGQPLHLFDYDQIEGNKIIVASDTSYTSLISLDGIERKIPNGSLLICDARKPLAFAGVIGGQSSAVTENTQRILIESAYFTPESIRKSSKHLGLRTEASARFEKRD